MGDSHRICEICHTQERYSIEKLFYARFPLDENRCKQWVKVVGNEDLVHVPIEKLHALRHVCEKHFQKRDFTKTKSRLKKRAVPKLNLTATPLTDNQLSGFPLHVAMDTDESVTMATSLVTSKSTEPGLIVTSSQPQTKVPVTSTVTSTSQLIHEPVSSTSTQIHPLHTPHAKSKPPMQTQLSSSECIEPGLAVISSQPQSKLSSNITPTSQLTHEPVPSTSIQTQQLQPSHSKLEVPVLDCNQSVKAGVKRKIVEEVDVTPRKKKLIQKLRKTKCTLASLRKSAKLIENISSTVLKGFVLDALKNQKRKPRGKRWTTKNKISALAIFKRSARVYRYLQYIVPLPSTKTLQNIIKKIPLEPGINESVLNKLKKSSESTTIKDKLCVLAFDEVALKSRLIYNEATDKVEGFVDFGNERTNEYADHALVFLLQGIHRKFKQPIAFYFLKGTVSSQKLAVLIKEIILYVKKTGYKILTTVCDQGPTNVGALRLLREWYNGGDNYFCLEDEKIYQLFDVPHLFKSVRNIFLNNGQIKMDGKTGKWEHLLEVEKQNRDFLYLSKITATHVQPTYRAKMRVKYAAQILSQTVAAVLKLMARSQDYEACQNEILQTASIVEDLNRLFDFTNGPSGPSDIKKGIRQNVSYKTEHPKVWLEFKMKMETMKFIKKNGTEARNIRCVDGWKMTLKSLGDIWETVKEYNFKYLNLRQLNQDALENLFGVIRQHSPTNKHPTCSGFIAALKTAVISGLTAPHSKNANCEKDLKYLFSDFHDEIFGGHETEIGEQQTETDNERKTFETTDIQHIANITEVEELEGCFSIPDDLEIIEMETDLISLKEQPVVYVSGYVAKVFLKNNMCQTCRKSLSISDPAGNRMYDIIKLREWWKDKKSLTYPSIELCRAIESMISAFQNEALHMLHVDNICQWTVTLFFIHCNMSWLCTDHIDIKSKIFTHVAKLLIRRQCQRVNLSLSAKEKDLDDKNKKGQQYGVSK